MRRGRMLLIALLTVVVATAGCGSSKKKVATSTATTVESSNTTIDSAALAAGMALAPAECRAALSALASAPTASFSGGGTQVDYKQVLDYMKKVQSSLPSEIKDDFAVLVDFYGKYVSVLVDNGIDFSKPETMTPAKLQKLGEAFKGLDSSKLSTASQHVSAYFTAHCKTG